jgi:hypothetical protein
MVSNLASIDLSTRLTLRRAVLLLSDRSRHDVYQRWHRSREALGCVGVVRRRLWWVAKTRLQAVNWGEIGFDQAMTDAIVIHRSILGLFISTLAYTSVLGKSYDLAHYSGVQILDRLETPRFIRYEDDHRFRQKLTAWERDLLERIITKQTQDEDNERLCPAATAAMEDECGRFYVIDLSRNSITRTHVDLPSYARAIGIPMPCDELPAAGEKAE